MKKSCLFILIVFSAIFSSMGAYNIKNLLDRLNLEDSVSPEFLELHNLKDSEDRNQFYKDCIDSGYGGVLSAIFPEYSSYHNDNLTAVFYHPEVLVRVGRQNKKCLFAAYKNGNKLSVRMYDVEDSEFSCIKTVVIPKNGEITAIAVNKSGTLAVATYNTSDEKDVQGTWISLHNLSNNQLQQVWKVYPNTTGKRKVQMLQFINDIKLIIAGEYDFYGKCDISSDWNLKSLKYNDRGRNFWTIHTYDIVSKASSNEVYLEGQDCLYTLRGSRDSDLIALEGVSSCYYLNHVNGFQVVTREKPKISWGFHINNQRFLHRNLIKTGFVGGELLSDFISPNYKIKTHLCWSIKDEKPYRRCSPLVVLVAIKLYQYKELLWERGQKEECDAQRFTFDFPERLPFVHKDFHSYIKNNANLAHDFTCFVDFFLSMS